MTDDPEFPEKTDLTLAVKSGALSYDYEKLQRGMEDEYKRSASFEPQAQAQELSKINKKFVNSSVDPEEFVLAIHGQPKYISQFFDLSKGSIKLKPSRAAGISKEREQRIIELMRILHDESDPTFGKVLQREKIQKDFNGETIEYTKARIRDLFKGLFNTNELRVLDARLRPIIEGQLISYEYNYLENEVVIELPRGEYNENFVSTTPEGDSIINLRGIHYLWYMANRKSLMNRLYARGYDDNEVYEHLVDEVPPGEMKSNHLDWSPRVGLYCALYAYIITISIAELGADSWDDQNFTINIKKNNKIIPVLAKLAAVKDSGVMINEFPNFKSSSDRIKIKVR